MEPAPFGLRRDSDRKSGTLLIQYSLPAKHGVGSVIEMQKGAISMPLVNIL